MSADAGKGGSQDHVPSESSFFRRALGDLWLLLCYGYRRRLAINVEGADVTFRTADAHSRRWFYPRYARGRIHEEPVARLLARDLRSAKCFVDVGAHLGFYACLAARVMESGTIHAFEMNRRVYRLLVKNVRLNTAGNVATHCLAVSAAPGERSYQRRFRSLCGADLKLTPREVRESRKRQVHVQAVSLDVFFAGRPERPDVVKIDVEGSEWDVLQGMRTLLQLPQMRLFIEVHPRELAAHGHSAEGIVQYLNDCGYTVHEVEGLRGSGGAPSLRQLHRRSPLSENAMLYAFRPESPP